MCSINRWVWTILCHSRALKRFTCRPNQTLCMNFACGLHISGLWHTLLNGLLQYSSRLLRDVDRMLYRCSLVVRPPEIPSWHRCLAYNHSVHLSYSPSGVFVSFLGLLSRKFFMHSLLPQFCKLNSRRSLLSWNIVLRIWMIIVCVLNRTFLWFVTCVLKNSEPCVSTSYMCETYTSSSPL